MYDNQLDQTYRVGRHITLVAGLWLVALIIGWFVVDGSGGATESADLWPWLLLIGAIGLLLVIARPVLAVISVLAFACVNPSLLPVFIEKGEFSVRYVDMFLSILALSVGFRIMIRRMILPEAFRQLFGPALPFLCYTGLSLALVWLHAPDFFAISIASYARLLVTVSFGMLLYVSIHNVEDLKLFHKALICFSVASVGIGMWEAQSSDVLGLEEIMVGWEIGDLNRYGGLLGVGSLGLVSGFLVGYAALRRRKESNWILRGLLLMLGLLGLILAKSVSSVLATAGVVTLYGFTTRAQTASFARLFKWAPIGMVAAMGAAGTVWALRSADVDGLLELSGGSFAQRLMIAYGGMLIFFEHPLVGVGWQASATPEFIGSPNLNAALMERFSAFPSHYFFLEKPTSLHNIYIQILAELGLIGGALFAYACVRIGRGVVRVVRGIPETSPLRSKAEFYAWGLVFLLIWWNTNPLFGGQTESLLAFAFLGALAAVDRLEKQRSRIECPLGWEMVTRHESTASR